jgi:hypothetical protein
VLQHGLGLAQLLLALAEQDPGPLQTPAQLAEHVAAGQPLGVALQLAHPAGHAGGEQQHGGDPAGHPEQHAQPDRAQGQRPGAAGLDLATGEQPLLLVLHRLKPRDQRVGDLPVTVEQLGSARRRPVRLDVGHQRGQERSPLVGEAPDLPDPVRLAGVVADQVLEVGDGLGQLPPGLLVGGQVLPFPVST